ncbi:MAG: endonuclease/exonuclease/phosphatase family protein [Cyclobacteriaceae bacterium]
MTFNIRYDNPGDAEHAWEHRKERVASILYFYNVDVFGLQEALHHQLIYLEEQFPNYERIGVGRDDGKEKGEYSPIFFNPSILESIDQGTLWLSKTPDKPSKDWDAALPRIATWILLRHISTKDTLLVCNTHFDHRGETARLESAKFLKEKLPQMAKNYPVILMGDFNSSPESEPYQTLVNGDTFLDAKKASEIPSIGPERTFSGFKVTPELTSDRIDHIFITSGLDVLRHATISEEQNGSYPSDHFPVFAELSW